MAGYSKKTFGLIIPKTKQKTLQKSKLSFFDEEEEEEHGKASIENEIKKANAKKKVRKQTQVTHPSLLVPARVANGFKTVIFTSKLV